MDFLDLPEDLHACILRQSGLSLVQTCKHLLRLFSRKENLLFFVEKYLTCAPEPLPPFFYASLPAYLLQVPFSCVTDLHFQNANVTGGYLLKQIYDLQYDSDIDVWVKGDKDAERAFREQYELDKSYDIVAKEQEPYTAISTFDFSIAQQGIVFEEGRKTLHVTFLSLYTYYSKKIVLTVAPLTSRYTIDNTELSMGIYEQFLKHTLWCKPQAEYCLKNCKEKQCYLCGKRDKQFHRCLESKCAAIVSGVHHPVFRRWFERIQKYEERFPGYETTYVLPPWEIVLPRINQDWFASQKLKFLWLSEELWDAGDAVTFKILLKLGLVLTEGQKQMLAVENKELYEEILTPKYKVSYACN